jgi:hypothetical protein
MTWIKHVLFRALFALESLWTDQAMTLLDFVSYKTCKISDTCALVMEGREIMNLKHVLLWVRGWTEQTLNFLLLSTFDQWKFRARWGLTFLIGLGIFVCLIE